MIGKRNAGDGNHAKGAMSALQGRSLGRPTVTGSPAIGGLLAHAAEVGASPEFRLRQRFGLTAAEGHLAGSLLDGLSLRQVSVHRHISINTARVHLASIFAKTGTHRQAELIRLMMTDGSGEHRKAYTQ